MDCPYLEYNHPQCSGSLNLRHLDEAFVMCTNHYFLCPIYKELSQREEAIESPAEAAAAS